MDYKKENQKNQSRSFNSFNNQNSSKSIYQRYVDNRPEMQEAAQLYAAIQRHTTENRPSYISSSESIKKINSPIQMEKAAISDKLTVNNEHKLVGYSDEANTRNTNFYTNVEFESSSIKTSNKNETVGIEMNAKPLGPDHPQGSDTSGSKATDKYITAKNAAFSTTANFSHFIRGHLLNGNLGGPGKPKNLYPITHHANTLHSSNVEKHVRTLVNDLKAILNYKVKVKDRKPSQGKATFECTVELLDNGNNVVKSQTVDIVSEPGNSSASGSVQGLISEFNKHKTNLYKDTTLTNPEKVANTQEPNGMEAEIAEVGLAAIKGTQNLITSGKAEATNADIEGRIFSRIFNVKEKKVPSMLKYFRKAKKRKDGRYAVPIRNEQFKFEKRFKNLAFKKSKRVNDLKTIKTKSGREIMELLFPKYWKPKK